MTVLETARLAGKNTKVVTSGGCNVYIKDE
jgi:hypothetical protein